MVLKQAIKVGDSGALALRLKEQRQVEQSYRKETKKQQYHKTYPQSCNKTSTTKWLTFEREVWLCLVSESTYPLTRLAGSGQGKRETKDAEVFNTFVFFNFFVSH